MYQEKILSRNDFCANLPLFLQEVIWTVCMRKTALIFVPISTASFFFKSSGAFCTLQVLRMMVGVNISDEQLGSIADRTIQEADQDGDSAISFAEFVKVGKLHF